MGILAEPAEFIRALKLPVGFSVCELGDQMVTHVLPHQRASEFYRALGCRRYVSIDANSHGTITADLNEPLPDLGRFDLVTDFGTGEHIFDQAQVWRSVHGLAKVGGYIAFDRPVQGYGDHGFYNTHETLFRDIAAANGYRTMRLERKTSTRGELIRGVFQRTSEGGFKVPQQGRYVRDLKL